MPIWIAPLIVSYALIVPDLPKTTEPFTSAGSAILGGGSAYGLGDDQNQTEGQAALTEEELDTRSDELIEQVKRNSGDGAEGPSDPQSDSMADQLIERMSREAKSQSSELKVTETEQQDKAETRNAKAESEGPLDDSASADVDAADADANANANANEQDKPLMVDAGSGSLEWIAAQAPEAITIQFSASIERASVESFLTKNQLPEPTAIFAFDRNGQTWYALIHGSFNSTRSAQAALAEMPQRTKSFSPWLRPFGSIQEIAK